MKFKEHDNFLFKCFTSFKKIESNPCELHHLVCILFVGDEDNKLVISYIIFIYILIIYISLINVILGIINRDHKFNCR